MIGYKMITPLLGEYADQGFTLEEEEDGLYLYFKDRLVRFQDGSMGTFNACNTIEGVQAACHRFICEQNSGLHFAETPQEVKV